MSFINDFKHMDKEIVYLSIFCGKGGLTRMKIIDYIIQTECEKSSCTNLDIQQLNANNISKEVGCAYNTARYHLSILNGSVGLLYKSNNKYSPKYTTSDNFDEELYSKIKNIIQSSEQLQNNKYFSKNSIKQYIKNR